MTDPTLPVLPSDLVSEELAKQERIIEKTKISAMQWAEALSVVAAQKLYRLKYPSFQEYCAKRWKIGRHRLYQLLDFQDIKKELTNPQNVDQVNTSDLTERNTRPLKKVPSEKRLEVFKKAKEAAGDKRPTSRQVESEVKTFKGQFAPPEPRKPFNPYGTGDAAPATDKKAVAQQAVSSLDYRKRLLAAFDDVCESNSDDWCLSRQAIAGLRTALEAVEI